MEVRLLRPRGPSWMPVEIIADFFQVFPGFAFLRRVTEQIGRMEGRHNFDTAKILELPAHPGNPFAYFQQVAKRGVSHNHNYVGLHSSDFPKQEGPAAGGFLECRLAIARRPAAIDVSDEDFLALHSDCFNDL